MHFSTTTLLVVLVTVFVAGSRAAPSSSNVISTDIPSGCITPAGEQQPSKTFLLYTVFKMNWHQALAHCNSMGMTLATLDSQQEYDTLVGLVKKAGRPGDFWLGGSDLGSEGKFIWVSTGQPMIYSNWSSGQPDHKNVDGEVEHCVVLNKSYEYLMNDRVCSNSAYLVCQVVDKREQVSQQRTLNNLGN